MPKTLTSSVGVRLDLHVHQRLIELAAADDRKLSSYIAKLCADHVRGLDQHGAVTDWLTPTPKTKRTR